MEYMTQNDIEFLITILKLKRMQNERKSKRVDQRN